MEIGAFTFAEVQPDPHTKQTISPAQRLRDVVELAVLADQAGLSVFGVGEHHRSDFAASSPAVVLGGIAARTTSIRLTSSVTVLSSADPVSVFEDFTAVDLLSGGRAEIMAGRGAFVESFPLYGYDVADYDALFDEKIDLLLRLRDNETLTWRGRFRPPLNRQGVYPRPMQERLPVWIGVGGTPTSVLRAARLGVPMAIGIIGGNPAQFAPLADLYRQQATMSGFDVATLPLAITSHAFVAPTSQAAADAFFPHYASYLGRLSRGAPMLRSTFERARELDGHLLVGSPAQLTEKILYQYDLFAHQLGQDAVVEAGHGADPAAGEGKHQQAVGAGDPGARVVEVVGQRELAVGPGRNQPVRAALPEDNRGEEPSRQLAALVLQRERRHGQPDIVGEQGDDVIDVTVRVGPGEPGDECPLTRGVLRRGRFLVA